MKKLTFLVLMMQGAAVLFAQQNNPLIDSRKLIDEAAVLHNEKKYDEALALYRKVPRSDSNYVLALYEQALTLYTDSAFDEARKICEHALKLKAEREREPDIYYLYGNIVDNMGKPEEALRIYDSGLSKYPLYPFLLFNKGVTLIKMERYAEAEKYLQQLIVTDPYFASAHFRLSQALYFQGKLIPSLLSALGYLVVYPDGPLSSNAINILSVLSSKHEEMKPVLVSRKYEPEGYYQELETLLMSKIALDPGFKPSIKLDDQISRQIQVVFEKARYEPGMDDFYNHYYIPMFRNVYTGNQFEDFINYIFSGVDIKPIQDYNRKNKKDIEKLKSTLVTYLNTIRFTHELPVSKREKPEFVYTYSEGKLTGRGKVNDAGDPVGMWEYYFPGGNLRSKGSYNNSSEREGEWQFFFFTGKLKAIERYKSGKVEGPTPFYFDNGNYSDRRNYKNDEYDGLSYSYYYTGGERIAENYTAGKKNGETRKYHTNGVLQVQEMYRNDTLHGPYRTFYNSGSTEYVAEYRQGELEGKVVAYHRNGNISSEGNYVRGKAEGQLKRYYENGKLKSIETYSAGELEGEYLEYHQNGKLYAKYLNKKGKTEGDAVFYDEDGKTFSVLTYSGDILKKTQYIDKLGKTISLTEANKSGITVHAYGPYGEKRNSYMSDAKGKIQGERVFYYSNGSISEKQNYKDGQLHGKVTGYHLNGRVSSEVDYAEGEKHGYFRSYFPSGTLQSEGWYQNDLMEGTWMWYDELGKLSIKTYYLNDMAHGVREDFWPNGVKSDELRFYYGWQTGFSQYDTLGNLIQEVDFHNGQVQYVQQMPNGKPFTKGAFKNGNLEGSYTILHFDGSVEYQRYYKHGLIDSTFRAYHYGNKLAMEGEYRLNERTGVWKNYSRQGTPTSIENYQFGEQHGKQTYFHSNGKVDIETDYVEGSRNGKYVKYDDKGNLMYQITYKDDLPVAYTYQDKTGQLLPEIPLPNSTGKLKAFYANGNPSAELEYVAGKLNGTYVLYHANGKIREKRPESFSITDGERLIYFDNGQLESSSFLVNDNLHGKFTRYNSKGVLVEAGTYYNDKWHGPLRFYDENGKLTETHHYHYGILLSVTK